MVKDVHMAFSINHLTPVIFGNNVSSETGTRLKASGCTNVLCIYDRGVKDAGITDDIVESITALGIKSVLYDGVKADPPEYTIEEAAEIGRSERVDGVVAIGGGSSMDTAKAVNILLGNPSPISQYMVMGARTEPGKLLFLLPTTSGTGSEVTPIAVITDSRENRKGGIMGPACRATMAIVDPVLTTGMPPSITADTGMDAFSHAAEAITSSMANPMSDILAEKAINLICSYLPRAVKNGNDMEAREKMSFAAMIAGYAFADSIPHLGHAIGHTLGSMFHVPHGNGCGVALPEVMEYISDKIPAAVTRVGNAMGLDISDNLSPGEIGEKVADAIKDLNKQTGLKTLKEHKIDESALQGIAEAAMSDLSIRFSPKETNSGDILKMLQSAYSR
jgi:alcohol dehydrogenase